MSTSIPMPLRAAAGLAAVAIDSARRLPKQLVGLPVLVVGTALQISLKAQQRYAELVARGDQLLGQLRPPSEGPPPWARFDDEPVGLAPLSGLDRVRRDSAFDAVTEPAGEPLDEEAAGVLGTGEAVLDTLADAELADRERVDGDLVDLPEPDRQPVEIPVTPDGVGDRQAGPDPADPASQAVEEEIEAVVAGESAAEPGEEEPVAAEPDVEPPEPGGYDGYLAVTPPLAGYDELSIPQLRGRLRRLSEEQLEQLVAYERSTAARAQYLTMLENRLTTVRSR